MPRGMKYQKLLNKWRKKDKITLIYLDAARYDEFKGIAGDITQDAKRIKKVNVKCRHTAEYMNKYWGERYPGWEVYAGTPAIKYGVPSEEYHGKNKFGKWHDIWDWGWDEKLGAVLPETIAEEWEENPPEKSKVILWFMQPHFPYVGTVKLTTGSLARKGGKSLSPNFTKYVKAIKEGKIPGFIIKRAYRDNLRRALRVLKDLVPGIKGDVVVTADHGDLLGESGRFLHPEGPKKKLFHVPWWENPRF